MVQFAYAVARSSSVETFVPARRMGQGTVARRVPTGAGFELGRKIGLSLLAITLLTMTGWIVARALDSTLLGFVFADLVFLVGIALRGAIAPSRGPHSRAR